MSHPQASAAFDEMDPHGFHTHDHADHVVVDWRILVGVLAALLFFTVLTTTMASLEQWVAAEWSVQIPHWVNVVGALTIAVIKATLVCMFFMQLRYDKPLNTMVLLFCLLALAIFLGFTSLDLGARDRVYAFKGELTHPGGDGQSVGMGGVQAAIGPRPDTMGKSMVEHARQRYIDMYNQRGEDGEAKWRAEMAHVLASHSHGAHHGPELSTANRSIVRRGLTPHLYDEHDPAVVQALEELGHEVPGAAAPSEHSPAGH